MVGAFKSLSTHEYIKNIKQNNWLPLPGKLWQRNYYEHIIRNEEAYLKIAEYIETNPQRWQEDTYYV
jgi:putative transposase